MDAQLKLTKALHSRILKDLDRSHPFALERVGYILCNHRDASKIKLVAFDYVPISDDFYIDDPECGARFSGEAIRLGMSLALEKNCCVLHVHTHEFGVSPSITDMEELPGVAQSIRNVCPSKTHGWLILSNTKVCGEIIQPAGEMLKLKNLTVVGFPMVLHSEAVHGVFKETASENQEESRQGFLGSDFDEIMSKTRIGIVGLGGGGSHIVQQLAHIGFSNFVLCDNDVIEATNLNRLVGATLADVRKKESKSAIAYRSIKNLLPNALVDSVPGWWEAKKNALAECDLVFGCVDSFSGRRDLEAFCRRNLIPVIDIGMDVKARGSGYEIYGQIALSLPGQACLHCLGIISDANLEEEAADYGEAGPKPQVVWPNGILASSAVGLAISLFSNWSSTEGLPLRLDYTGSTGVVSPPATIRYLKDIDCPHYNLEHTGTAKFISV